MTYAFSCSWIGLDACDVMFSNMGKNLIGLNTFRGDQVSYNYIFFNYEAKSGVVY